MLDAAISSASLKMKRVLAARMHPAPSRHIRYTGFVPSRVPGGILKRKGGGLLAMWQVRGIPFELLSDDEMEEGRLALNDRLMAMFGERRGIWSHVVKSKADPADHPIGTYESDLSRETAERLHAELFRRDKPLLRMDLYLTAWVRPTHASGSQLGINWLRGFLDNRREDKDRAERLNERRLQEMEKFCGDVEAHLESYGLKRLGVYEEEGCWFSEMYEGLHHILYNQRRKIGVARAMAARSIYTNRIQAAGDVMHIHQAGGDRFGALFTNQTYSITAKPTIYRNVLEGDIPVCLTNVFNYWRPAASQTRMRMQRNRMFMGNDPAVGQASYLVRGAERIQDGHYHLGGHYFSLAAYADDAGGAAPNDPARLEYLRQAAEKAVGYLSARSVSAIREDLTLNSVIYAQLPGNESIQPCPAEGTSINMAAWSPLWNYPKGMLQGHWGDPLLTLRTKGWTGFHLHLHAPKAIDESGDLGNVLCVGPSGSGKTVIAAAIIGAAERHRAERVVYDRDQGLKIFIEYQGGVYLDLPVNAPTGMAPLKGLRNTPDNRGFLVQWLLAKRKAAGLPHSDDQERRLNLGIRRVMGHADPRRRTLRELRPFLGEHGGWLDRWCCGPNGDGEGGGALWWAFDGPEDHVAARHSLTGRNTNAILGHAEVAGPAMAYLFYTDTLRLDGTRRFMLVVDEFWKALLVQAFAELINEMLRVIRKKQGVVFLLTQSIKDVHMSPIGHVILGMSPTRLWMADPRADLDDHLKAGLTEQMWKAIKRAKTVTHPFLVEQGEQVVLASLPLPPDIVAIMSGTDPRLKLQARLKRQYGDDPAAWGPHYRRLWHTAKPLDKAA